MEKPEVESDKRISDYQKLALERLQKHLENCPNCCAPRDLCAEGYWLRKMAELP